MTAFIVPGDIMRQTQATMRHRGVTMDDGSFVGTENLIVGGGQASVYDSDAAIPTEVWLRGSFVVTYNRATNIAMVTAPALDLAYEFTAEES